MTSAADWSESVDENVNGFFGTPDQLRLDELPPDDAPLFERVTGDPHMPEPQYDTPGPRMSKAPRAPRNSKEYTDQTTDIIRMAVAFTAPNGATVADAAALIQYGDNVAEAVGALAAHDERVAAMLRVINGGTANPYSTAIMALAPLVLQIVRNHEPVLEPAVRGIPIPFLKKKDGTKRVIRLRFGVKLGRLRAVTNPPEKLYAAVYDNPEVMRSLQKQGINVAPLGER